MVLSNKMKKKIMILYDLKNKSNKERTRIIQKLYGHRDKSNYKYVYEREGLLNELNFEKSNKTFLKLKDKKDLTKVAEILKNLKVDFEVAEIQ